MVRWRGNEPKGHADNFGKRAFRIRMAWKGGSMGVGAVIRGSAVFVIRSTIRVVCFHRGFVAVGTKPSSGMISRLNIGFVVHGSIPHLPELRL